MGKQIQHILAKEDENKLIDYLERKFSVRVVDQRYPSDWNRQCLVRSESATRWIIVDERVIDILIQSANQIPRSGQWQIRSKSRSCIEWNRNLYGKGETPARGRLYLDTHPHEIYKDISAATGDDIARQYRSAASWLKRYCVNVSEYSYGIWQSKEL